MSLPHQHHKTPKHHEVPLEVPLCPACCRNMADNMAASAVRLSTSDHVSLRSTLIFLNAARIFQHVLRFQSLFWRARVLRVARATSCYHTCVKCSKALKAREIFVRNLPKSRFNGVKRSQLMQQRMKNLLHRCIDETAFWFLSFSSCSSFWTLLWSARKPISSLAEETWKKHPSNVTMPGVFSKLESHLSLIALDASLQTWAEDHSPTCVLFEATGYEFAPVRCGVSQWVVATIPCTSYSTYQSCKFRLLLLDLGSQLLNALLPRSVSCTVEKRYCANLTSIWR